MAEPQDVVDEKVYGKGIQSGEYFPKRTSKAGKAIYDEINQLPVVSRSQLNQTIGFDENLCHIGYSIGTHLIGIIVDEDWEVDMPEDCEEVTLTRYKKSFPTK